MGVVAEVADRVTVMNQARPVEHGEIHRIFNQPQERYTQALLRAVPKLGSMAGKSQPEKFLLVEDTETAAETVSPTSAAAVNAKAEQPPLLRVSNLVKRFPIRSGLMRRISGNVTPWRTSRLTSLLGKP